MKQLFHCCGLVSALALTTTQSLPAQSFPREQPNLLTIHREKVKAGRSAEHAKHEAGWPAAFAKAKSPVSYLALASITGSPEVWYMSPWKSYAAEAEAMKLEDSDPVLQAELQRLAARDAEFIDSLCVVQAIARKDLSIGEFPDLTKARFFEIGVYHVRQGQTERFDQLAKAYGAARQRVAPKSGYRFYMVTAGMPTPTYLMIRSVEDYAQFDQVMADDLGTFTGFTDSEKSLFAKAGEVVEKEEYNRFRLDPAQSHVPKEVREQSPDFWMPK